MCITLSAADIKSTRLVGFEKGGYHTVFYGTDAIESADENNALCFSVPTDYSFGKANFVDMSAAPSSLTKAMKKAYDEVEGNDEFVGRSAGRGAKSVQIFRVGNWQVAVAYKAKSARQILTELERIPQQFRPLVSEELLDTFLQLQDPIVMAVFMKSEAKGGMEDLVYSFIPRNSGTLVLPALDGHGEAPKRDYVERRHFIAAATAGTIADYSVDVTAWLEAVPALERLIPYELVGDRAILFFEAGDVQDWTPNGDIVFPLGPLTVAGSRRNFNFVWPRQLG